jgi:hypothetical protein
VRGRAGLAIPIAARGGCNWNQASDYKFARHDKGAPPTAYRGSLLNRQEHYAGLERQMSSWLIFWCRDDNDRSTAGVSRSLLRTLVKTTPLILVDWDPDRFIGHFTGHFTGNHRRNLIEIVNNHPKPSDPAVFHPEADSRQTTAALTRVGK